MKIGFIGLGNMGGPMAANLAKAGHEVAGFDMADVAIDGVSLVKSAEEAATGRYVVITMLPNGADPARGRGSGHPGHAKRRGPLGLLDR